MTHSNGLPLSLACVLATLTLACNDDSGADAETTASTTETSGDGDGDGDPATGDGDGDGDPTTGDGDGEPAECGNGVVEPGEDCDDENDVETDYCTSACTAPCALQWEQSEAGVVTGQNISFGDMKIDNAGNIVVGYQRDGQPGERDAWVAKYDPSGETMMWEANLSGASGTSVVANIALGIDDEVYAVGTRIGADEEDIWYARLAAADGAEVWNLEHDGMLDASEDGARGVAVGSDGVVVVGTVRDVAMDSDIWVRKVDFDGNELWTTTYSGTPAMNGFSLDTGGLAAVAADGTVYVTGHVYVDFETLDLTLLSYAADGTGPDWEITPQSGGTGHSHGTDALELEEGTGSLYLAFTNLSSPVGTFWISRYDVGTGDAAWTLSNDDLAAVGDPDNWDVVDLVPTIDGVAVAGSWFDDEWDTGIGRRVGYVAYFDGEGAPLCYGGHGFEEPADGPSALFLGATDLANGMNAVAHGIVVNDGSFDRWLGQFGAPG